MSGQINGWVGQFKISYDEKILLLTNLSQQKGMESQIVGYILIFVEAGNFQHQYCPTLGMVN